jgi:hypothetical protein
MSRILSTLASTAALVALIGATPSFAVPITITSGNPGNIGTDNVLFNDSSLAHSGTLVQGNFSGSGTGFIVDFTSASGNHLIEGSGGQATISGLAGNNPFTSLTFGLESGATFTKAILNADVVNGAPSNATINFNVAYVSAAGSPFAQSFSVSGNGQNFFGIEAGDGAKITSVTFSSANTAFLDANQFRLGGFAAATTVPDGGMTATLLGAGLLVLGLFRRKLRN